MHSLSEYQLFSALLAIAVILLVGRGTAELARKVNQPEVLGELLGGFLLGPSVFGALFPGPYRALFLDPGVSLALSSFSWVGAILLLLIAGMEAELGLLKQHAKAGSLASVFAIVSSIIAGWLFAARFLSVPPYAGLFLGVIMSVTAVSVAAKILMERDAVRRGYAQVILAAGIGSEVVVWLLIAVLASLQSGRGNPALAGAKSAGFAILFFVLMLTVVRRFVFWAMRRVKDLTQVVNGQLSLVVILAFVSASITQALGLHALLGAFTFGVLLGESPRADLTLKKSIQTVTVGLFAPIFFVLAGMRVDIFKLGSFSSIGTLVGLFLVATLVKVTSGALGAKLGGLKGWEPAMVGVGLNLKGGTDVIVAILGMELGLCSTQTYTMYTVVAMLTVLVSPPVMAWLDRRVPPSKEESDRLSKEEAKRRAYLSDVERVLAPVTPELLPSSTAHILQTIAKSKEQEKEIFDITEMSIGEAANEETIFPEPEVILAEDQLGKANQLETVEVTSQPMDERNPAQAIIEAAAGYRIVAMGARRPSTGGLLSFGKMQDKIIDKSQADVLLVVDHEPSMPMRTPLRRILVPVNGMEYSMAAADVAAYIAKSHEAEIVLLNVMDNQLDPLFWREGTNRDLLDAGYRILNEVAFRTERLDVPTRERVRLAGDPGKAILAELSRNRYELLVMGVVARTGRAGLYFGKSAQSVLLNARLPVVLLISHNQPQSGKAAA